MLLLEEDFRIGYEAKLYSPFVVESRNESLDITVDPLEV